MRLLPWLVATLAAMLSMQTGAAASPWGQRWQAVLVAGDDSEAVFDDGVRAFAWFLLRHGVPLSAIHRFSTSPREPGAAPATATRLLPEISRLPVAANGRCLIFITSHGEHGKGIWVADDDDTLSPKQLARTLAGNCAAVPTVVIASSCYSGAFAAPPMTAPNRIVLTASRADRPSFGCQVGRTYTVYDECLLDTLPQVTDWQAAYRRTAACVHRREQELDVLPSLPQAWFGAAVRGSYLWF